MLSSHAYYAIEVNLLFSNYAEKFFSMQTKFSMRAHALNGGPRIIITFSHEERFEASLLLSLVSRFLPIIPA